jgi:hypothetical protein
VLVPLLFCFLAHAVDTLPMVKSSEFTVGRTWVWNYFEGSRIFSTERYQVLARAGSVVTIEMASHYDNEGTFKAHHRLEVDLERCLDAHSRLHDYRPWALKMYFLNGAQWERTESVQHTLPFEEKFNCDPHVRTLRPKATVFGTDPSGNPVFQQRRYGVDRGTWFHLEGENAGTAAFKQMGPGYHFELVSP